MKKVITILIIMFFQFNAFCNKQIWLTHGNDLVELQIEQSSHFDKTIFDKSDILSSMLKDATEQMQLDKDILFFIKIGCTGMPFKPTVSIGTQKELFNGAYCEHLNSKTILIEFEGSDFEIDELLKLCLYVRTHLKELEDQQQFIWTEDYRLDSFQINRIPQENLTAYKKYSNDVLTDLYIKKYQSNFKQINAHYRIKFYYQYKKYHFYKDDNQEKVFLISPTLFQYKDIRPQGPPSLQGLLFTSPFEYYYVENLLWPIENDTTNYKVKMPTIQRFRTKDLSELSFDSKNTRYPSVHFTIYGNDYSQSFLCLLYENIAISDFQEKRDSLISTLLPKKDVKDKPTSNNLRNYLLFVLCFILFGAIFYISKPRKH